MNNQKYDYGEKEELRGPNDIYNDAEEKQINQKEENSAQADFGDEEENQENINKEEEDDDDYNKLETLEEKMEYKDVNPEEEEEI